MTEIDRNAADGGVFQRTAYLAGVTEEEWVEVEGKLPNLSLNPELLQRLLKIHGLSSTILFCFEDTLLLHYEGTLSLRWSPLYTKHRRERIAGKNEVVDPSAGLSCESLRSIFVMIEALVYKCVHLRLEGQSSLYRQQTEDYEKRLHRLVSHDLLGDADRILAMELYNTRCQFAHSLKSVEDITYLSVGLKDRWGSSGVTRGRELKRYFLPDAFRYSNKLLDIFKPVQVQQIDSSGFKADLVGYIDNDNKR